MNVRNFILTTLLVIREAVILVMVMTAILYAIALIPRHPS